MDREDVLAQFFFFLETNGVVVVVVVPSAQRGDYNSSASALMDLQCSPAQSGLLVL